MTQQQTRIQKANLLCIKWMQYVLNSTDKGEAFSDFRIWLLTTFAKSKLSDYEIPWIPFPLTRWLHQYLQPSMSVFEWGSGASTLFFAKRVNHVVSIEYDQLWHKTVTQLLSEKRIDNVDLCHIAPEAVTIYANSEPATLQPFQSKLFPDHVFVQYVSCISNYPDKYFDLILVDGRARMACLELALQKVKDSGIILLDNTERIEYQQYQKLTSSSMWSAHQFNGPVPANIWPVFGQTTIFSQQPHCFPASR